MAAKRIEFKTFTNFDVTERSAQQEDEDEMEQEIQSAGNRAFGRSDIMYMIDERKRIQSDEEKKKKELEQELAKFRVNALKKKQNVVISIKEKRMMDHTPPVIIKKKKQRVGKKEKKLNKEHGISTEDIVDPQEEGTSGYCDSNVKGNTGGKCAKTPHALDGILGDYSDSDTD